MTDKMQHLKTSLYGLGTVEVNSFPFEKYGPPKGFGC
jgi:hypothetical protein